MTLVLKAWVENVIGEKAYTIRALDLRHLLTALHHLTETLSFHIQEHLLSVI